MRGFSGIYILFGIYCSKNIPHGKFYKLAKRDVVTILRKMKMPKMFIPEKNSEPKIEQLLEAPKLPRPEERYETEIEKIIKKDHVGYEFPLNEAEIENILEKLPAAYIEGLEKIVITSPSKNEDYQNYGRYVQLSNKTGKILLFVHQRKGDNFVVYFGNEEEKEFTCDEFKDEARKAVLHEVGHHVGIRYFKDYSEKFAKDFVERFLYLLE